MPNYLILKFEKNYVPMWLINFNRLHISKKFQPYDKIMHLYKVIHSLIQKNKRHI